MNQGHLLESIESGRTNVDGINIYWEKFGRGPHVVLFLPPLLGDISSCFHPVWKKMDAEKFTCVGLDLPGFGKSRPPDREHSLESGEFIFSRDARLAKELMDKLGYKKYSLTGGSGGAAAAILLASDFPDAVEKVVVTNAPCGITKQDVDAAKAILDLNKWPTLQRRYVLGKYGRDYVEKVLRDAWEFADDEFRKNTHRDKQAEKVKKNFKAPILDMVGMEDTVVSPGAALEWKKLIPHLRIHEVQDGLHSNLTFLSEYVRVMQEFLLS